MLFRMGKKVLIRMPLLPGLNDDPAGLEAAFAMLREEAAQGAVHLRKTLSGGASGGTQGFSRGPGHGGIALAACPERVSLCWNTLKFLQGRKNVGSLQKRFPSLPQYCLKP